MREAQEAEERAVRGFFEALEPGLWGALQGRRGLAVGEDGRVLLVAPGVLALPAGLREGAAGGLCIGVLEEDGFCVGLAGAVELGFRARVPALRLTDRGAWMFAHGWAVHGESVARAPPGVQHGDLCLVQAPTGEVVGLGEVVGTFKGKRPALRPVHDVGAYLREEDEAPEARSDAGRRGRQGSGSRVRGGGGAPGG